MLGITCSDKKVVEFLERLCRNGLRKMMEFIKICTLLLKTENKNILTLMIAVKAIGLISNNVPPSNKDLPTVDNDDIPF